MFGLGWKCCKASAKVSEKVMGLTPSFRKTLIKLCGEPGSSAFGKDRRDDQSWRRHQEPPVKYDCYSHVHIAVYEAHRVSRLQQVARSSRLPLLSLVSAG